MLARLLQPDAEASLASLLQDWVRYHGWVSCGWSYQGKRFNSANSVSAQHDLCNKFCEQAQVYAGGDETNRWIAAPLGSISSTRRELIWVERPDCSLPITDSEVATVAVAGAVLGSSPVYQQFAASQVSQEFQSVRFQDAATASGRIAHDFDNIFTGVLGFADLVKPLLSSMSAKNYVQEIERSGQRGLVLTKRLHQFARANISRPLPGSICQAIQREVLKLPKTIRVHQTIPPNLPPVAIDTPLLGDVFAELFTNGAEAMPQGGDFWIQATVETLSFQNCRLYFGSIQPGQVIRVTLRDSGGGVSVSLRERLFCEPFVTNKPRSRGFGLGIVYRILCAHSAGIQLEYIPPPDSGTVASVVFPLAGPGSIRGLTPNVR
jgi:signal transduction histidine kinase